MWINKNNKKMEWNVTKQEQQLQNKKKINSILRENCIPKGWKLFRHNCKFHIEIYGITDKTTTDVHFYNRGIMQLGYYKISDFSFSYLIWTLCLDRFLICWFFHSVRLYTQFYYKDSIESYLIILYFVCVLKMIGDQNVIYHHFKILYSCLSGDLKVISWLRDESK